MSIASTHGSTAGQDPVHARQYLLDTLAGRIESGRYDTALAAVPDEVGINDMADRMLASLPTQHAMDQLIGPFYDTAGLTKWLNVSRQAVHKQVAHRRMLAVKTVDGVMLYPSFQFDAQGTALPHLYEVLQLLDPDELDPWGSALWLSSPAKLLNGDSPAQRLRANDLHEVLAIAERINAAEQVG